MHTFNMPDNYQTLVSEYVKLVRKETGWSQGLLAEKVGVAQSTIQRAESKNYEHQTKLPTLFKIEKISEIPLPEALRRADGASPGAADDGRVWEDEKPEKYRPPVYYQDWSGELDPVRFGRFVKPMVSDLFGSKAARPLTKARIKVEIKSCLAWVEAAREDDPTATVGEHVAEYLWLLLTRMAAGSEKDIDYARWRRAARRAAESLMEKG